MVRKTLMLVVVVSLATFGTVACSDDTGGSNGSGSDSGMTEDMSSPDGSGLCRNNQGPACSCVRDEYVAETPPSCSDSSPPSRCGEDVITFSNWGPASVVTDLTLPQGETEVGFDMDNADGVDNTLPSILGGLASLAGVDVASEIKQSLLSGELILVAEHQGLSSLSGGESFQSNFTFGAPADQGAQGFISKVDSSCSFGGESSCELEGSVGEDFLVSPESFEVGVYPQAFVGDATIENGKLTAGPGKILLSVAAPQLGQIELQLNGATIEAQVDTENSSIGGDSPNGVTLVDGELGGYVKARQLFELGNSILSGCGCLGKPEAAFDLPEDEDTEICPPDSESSNCKKITGCTVDASSCSVDDDGMICGRAGTVCGALPGVVTQAMDLDTDCDGTDDAISFGASFKAAGARIKGTTPQIAIESQSNDGSSVTVDKVISPVAGHVVVFEQGDDYNPSNALGSATVSQGAENEDISVTLDPALSSTTQLQVVLVDDEGSTSGEYDSGDSVVTYGPDIQMYENFTLTVSGG